LLDEPQVLLDHRLFDLREIGAVRERVAGLDERGSGDAWHRPSVRSPSVSEGPKSPQDRAPRPPVFPVALTLAPRYTSPPMQSRKPALGFILVPVALDVLGFGLLIPVAPRLVMSLIHADEAHAAPYVSGLQSTFFAISFLFAPLLGVLSDKVGRRPIL